MTQLNWRECWDELREEIRMGPTGMGRNALLALMDNIERTMVRKEEDAGINSNPPRTHE